MTDDDRSFRGPRHDERGTVRRTLPGGAVYTHTDPAGDPEMRAKFDAAMERRGEKAAGLSRCGTPSHGGHGPWVLRLVCCGFDDGRWRCETWEAASDLRRSYCDAEGHERSAVLTYEQADGTARGSTDAE